MTNAGQRVSPLLVGRDDLLSLADRRIGEVLAGNGQFLLLAGEPGIGKTRFLKAILTRAEEAGFRIAKGDLSPHDQLVVLACVHDLARSMDGATFGDLGSRILAAERSRSGDSLSARRGLVRDVVDTLMSAADRPTVLAFEDLQWADDMTLEVIGELARAMRSAPLLLLGAHRLDPRPGASPHREWRARLLTQRLAEELPLQRLSRDETALVTTLLLGTGLPAPREVVDAVFKRTNGIPLHIEELLAAVGGEVSDRSSILGAHVPDTIEDAVLAHVGHLSESAQSIARAGAVLGRCFAPDVLAGVLDRPVGELDDGLDELVAAGILYPFEFVDEGYYDFRHQLLRDALYDSVPARDLRRYHARAAEFWGTLIGTSEIHASAHYERAGMHDEAFRAAMAAAAEASRVYSHREAFDLYRRAIHNMPASLPDAEKARVWMAYSDAAGTIDRNDVAGDAAARCRELAILVGDRELAAEALCNLASISRREGEPIVARRDEARRLMLELDALPDSEPKRNLHLIALSLLAAVEMDALNLREARSYFKEWKDVATRWGREQDAVDAESYLGVLDVLEGRSRESLAVIGERADWARAEGHETLAVESYRDVAYFSVRTLDYRTADLRITDGLKYTEEVQQSFCGHILASTQAVVSWAKGRWDEAEAQGGQALSDPGSGRSGAIAEWALGWTAACRGDRATAETHLTSALEFGRRGEWLELVLPPQWGLAEAALIAGDPAGAIAWCEEALTSSRAAGEYALLAPFVVTGVRAYQAAGRPDAAAKWLGQVVRAIGPLAEVASPAIRHGTGLVKLAEGSIGAAREALEAAVREWDERERRWEALWARLDLAAADLRVNRHAEAMALVREVTAAAEALASQPLLDRAAQLTRLSKGRGAEVKPWHPLTVREFEVAQKIAEGLTNAQIADELMVSPKTVSAHVEHILAKLGVARRAEVAAWVATLTAVAIS